MSSWFRPKRNLRAKTFSGSRKSVGPRRLASEILPTYPNASGNPARKFFRTTCAPCEKRRFAKAGLLQKARNRKRAARVSGRLFCARRALIPAVYGLGAGRKIRTLSKAFSCKICDTARTQKRINLESDDATLCFLRKTAYISNANAKHNGYIALRIAKDRRIPKDVFRPSASEGLLKEFPRSSRQQPQEPLSCRILPTAHDSSPSVRCSSLSFSGPAT